MNWIKRRIEYWRALKEWHNSRPYSGFSPFEHDWVDEMKDIARKLAEWENSKPPKP